MHQIINNDMRYVDREANQLAPVWITLLDYLEHADCAVHRRRRSISGATWADCDACSGLRLQVRTRYADQHAKLTRALVLSAAEYEGPGCAGDVMLVDIMNQLVLMIDPTALG